MAPTGNATEGRSAYRPTSVRYISPTTRFQPTISRPRSTTSPSCTSRPRSSPIGELVQTNGDAGCGLEIVEVPKARWAKVHTGSIFHQSEELPAPAERDDTVRLLQIANSLSESQAGAIEAELALGWLDPNWNVGDIVERIEGRELGFTPFPGAAPHVQAVAHRCGEEWTTRLTVSG